jgi:transcriptional regulator with XRE-family HTH domain
VAIQDVAVKVVAGVCHVVNGVNHAIGGRAMDDFPGTLRSLMSQRQVSAKQVARHVPCDPSLISRYRNGRQQPSAKMAARLDELLGADGRLAGLADRELPARRAVLAGGLLAGGLMSMDSAVLDRMAWAERHPRQIDAAVVDSLADVLAAQRRAEDALGSAALLRPVLAQLAVVEDLVKQVHGALRPALMDIAQQWAQFAGWLCSDAGDVSGARACYGQALEWAVETGDATMTATILRERCLMAYEGAETGAMIGLASAAQRDPRAAVHQRAYAAALEARGYAMAGNVAAAERKLGEASELAAQVDSSRGSKPWSYWLTPEFFQNAEGVTCGYLAGTAPGWHGRAITLLSAWAQGDGAALWARTSNLTHLAFTHAQAGDLDQACAVAIDAVQAARRSGSVRHAGRLAGIQSDLAARWAGDPRVDQLAEVMR